MLQPFLSLLPSAWPTSSPSSRACTQPFPPLPSSPLPSLSGLTKSSELPQFRSTHSIALKKADTGRRPAPPLPSDHDPRHTYGLPGTFRNAQTQREKGPYEAPMKHLMQVGEGA